MKTIVATFVVALALPSLAFAQQQSTAQQACINAFNKGMAKLASTQGKAAGKCLAGYAKGANTNATSCYQSDEKVNKVVDANDLIDGKYCSSSPDFGPAGPTSLNYFSVTETQALAEDLFGTSPAQMITTCDADAAACKCQMKTTKAMFRLHDTRLKSFNTCQRNGLKSETAPIDSAADLAGCLSIVSTTIDAAVVKLQVAIAISCEGVATPFDTGPCTGLTGVPLINCVDARTACRACRVVVASDALEGTVDCDALDDATVNGSCSNSF